MAQMPFAEYNNVVKTLSRSGMAGHFGNQASGAPIDC